MIKAVVIGATGYAGEELIKILIKHPQVKITGLIAKIEKPDNISHIFPALSGRLDMECGDFSVDSVLDKSDVAFLALPHRVSMEVAPKFLGSGKKVIDLSADYRLKDVSTYKKYYGVEHKDIKGLKEAVYGLPELYRDKIKKAELIANPGCYPTSVILAGLPAVKKGLVKANKIIADSKSGVTGAGRNPDPGLHFPEVNENIKAYKIFSHQHQPEMAQELSLAREAEVNLIFVPHLMPINRGILTTLYFDLASPVSTAQMLDIYRKFYAGHPFVRIKPEEEYPQVKDVAGTNFCDIGLKVQAGSAVVVSAIDNLVKGASGQAVQNMNLMAGFEEIMGLL